MISTKSLLLACTTLVAIAPAFAAAPDAPFTAAQARPRDNRMGIPRATHTHHTVHVAHARPWCQSSRMDAMSECFEMLEYSIVCAEPSYACAWPNQKPIRT